MKNRILVVAGHKGRNFQLKYATQELSVHSILKPYSYDKDLIETAITNSESFPKKGVIIFWPSGIGYYLSKAISKLKHILFSSHLNPTN